MNSQQNANQHVFVVLNPRAGNSDEGDAFHAAVANHLPQLAWTSDIYETTGKEDVAKICREACADGATMQITRIASPGELDPREWDELVQRSANATVFQTRDWVNFWWTHSGHHDEPLILVARSVEGQLLGIAPLLIHATSGIGRTRRVARFIGTPIANYTDFIVSDPAEAVLGAFVRWLADHRDIWDDLHLSNILNTSPTLQYLGKHSAPEGFRVLDRLNAEAPLLQLGTDPEADKQLIRKKDIRQKQRRLKETGELRFSRETDADLILSLLPEFFRQHTERHENHNSPGRSEYLQERSRSLLAETIKALAPPRRLGLDVLWLDHRPIAFQFFLIDVAPHRMILKMPSFDPAYAEYSAGNVLLMLTIEKCVEESITQIDFSTGENEYKYRFTNRIQSVHSLLVTSDPFIYAGFMMRWRMKDWLRNYRRKYPGRVRTLRRLKRRLGLH